MRRNRFCQLLTTAAVTLLTSALVIAAPQPVVTPAAKTPSSAASVNAAPQIWNLKDADIRAVIQTMSILTGKSFIVSKQIQGRVTLISHKPMSIDEMYEVFLSMLRMMNFSAVEASTGVVKIVQAEQANMLSRQIATDAHPGMGSDVVVRVVSLNNVSAVELVPVIRPLLSESDMATAYMPSNSLIIAGTASNISRIVTLIRQMDESNINQIRVFHLQYANANKVVSVIKELQSASVSQGRVSNVSMAADTNGNNILVNANAANQLLVKRLIDELDQKSATDDDTRVVKLNYLTAKKFAPILMKVAQGGGAGAAAAGAKAGAAVGDTGPSAISIQAEDDNNALIIHAPGAVMAGLMSVVSRLDHRPKQVLVEAIIVKVSESVLNKLGIVWGAVNSDGTIVGVDSTTGGSSVGAVSTAPDDSFQLKIHGKGVGFLPSGNLGMLLHLLKTNGSSDVLATPSVVVLNNQKASIADGQNVGLANRTYQGAATPSGGDQSVTPFNTLERQNVALSLEVTPHISPNKMIRMELLQKDDTLASDSASSSADNPKINTSSIKTSVLVKSGDILVLGGLISNEQEKNVQKLPILGDLPLLGHLFRYDTHKMQKTSLMVFIRPIVMDGDNADTQTHRRYRYMRQEQFNVETRQVEGRRLPVLPKLSHTSAVQLQPPVMSLPQPEGLPLYRKPKQGSEHGK